MRRSSCSELIRVSSTSVSPVYHCAVKAGTRSWDSVLCRVRSGADRVYRPTWNKVRVGVCLGRSHTALQAGGQGNKSDDSSSCVVDCGNSVTSRSPCQSSN